jgi:predicted CoA-binding protein
MSTDDTVEEILSIFATITVVGASTVASKPAHYVPAEMQAFGWRIVPVNPLATTVLGERAFPTLTEASEQTGFVNVFRPARATPAIAREAVAVGTRALWLQLGIASDEARSIAEAAGLLYVEDRCLLVERRRLGLSAPQHR